MKRHARQIMILCIAAVAAVASGDVGAETKPARSPLIGSWKVLDADIDGLEWPREGLVNHSLNFVDGKKFQYKGGLGVMKTSGGTYVTGRSGKLNTIDLTQATGFHRGRAFVGLYRIDGKRLVLCCGVPALTSDAPAERPKGFVPKPAFGIMRMTLERVKG